MRILLAAALLLFTTAAHAQFPDRPLRIVVGYPPGGAGDFITRLAADMAQRRHNHPVVVENRSGANGMIGAQNVARSEADGSSVFQCSMGTMTIVPFVPGADLPVDVTTELVPVAVLAFQTYGLVTAANAPFRSVDDVMAAARAQPGRISYASTGQGSAQHLAAQMLATLAGVQMLHVPYRGGAPAIVDLLARRVDIFVTTMADAAGHVRDGRLRVLGLGNEEGHPAFPGVPFIGATVPGYSMLSWLALCGPRGMPPATINAWAEAVRLGLEDETALRRISEAGLTPHFEGPDALASRMEANRQRFRQVISAAGIRFE